MTSERASSFCPSVEAVCRHSDSYLWSPSPALVKKNLKKPNKQKNTVKRCSMAIPPACAWGLGQQLMRDRQSFLRELVQHLTRTTSSILLYCLWEIRFNCGLYLTMGEGIFFHLDKLYMFRMKAVERGIRAVMSMLGWRKLLLPVWGHVRAQSHQCKQLWGLPGGWCVGWGCCWRESSSVCSQAFGWLS